MSERATPGRSVRETVSFRLPADVVERLDARAALLGATRTTLAEQYLEEGLRLVEHPGIHFADGPAGRRAVVHGGLDVWEMIEIIKANGGSIQAAAAYLDRPASLFRAAARYYAAYPAEIDARIRANAEAAARERDLAEAQRRLLG